MSRSNSWKRINKHIKKKEEEETVGGLRLLGQGRALLRNIVRLAGNTRHSCGHQWKVAFVFVKCSRPPAFWVHLLSFSLFFFPQYLLFSFFFFLVFFLEMFQGEGGGGARSLLSQHLPPCWRENVSLSFSYCLTFTRVCVLEEDALRASPVGLWNTVFAGRWGKCVVWNSSETISECFIDLVVSYFPPCLPFFASPLRFLLLTSGGGADVCVCVCMCMCV